MITKRTTKKKALELGKDCKKCGHCCSFGSGYVLNEGMDAMAKALNITKEQLKKDYLEGVEVFNTDIYKIKTKKQGKPYGKCILFSKEKGCTIHESKPLHCRIGNCNKHGEELAEWFFLNYTVNKNDPESIRQWAARLKVKKTIRGGELEDLVPDKAKLIKILTFRDNELR